MPKHYRSSTEMWSPINLTMVEGTVMTEEEFKKQFLCVFTPTTEDTAEDNNKENSEK